MLDATRLRVLVAIARHGSVTAAAQALNYAQPSISHHMARLEAETGAKLMERAGRGIRLTEAGQLLAERAAEILGRIDAAEAELAAHVGLQHERVRLAAFGSALATLVPDAARALLAGGFSAELFLTQAEPAEAVRSLRSGAADVALVYRYVSDDAGADPTAPGAAPDGWTDLRCQLLLDEPVFVVRQACPAGEASLAASSPRVMLADLAPARWIAGCEQGRQALVHLCTCAGFSPDVAVSVGDYVAAQALVAAGLGTALLPGLALRSWRHLGIVADELPGARHQVHAVLYGAPPDPPATSQLLAALVRAGAAGQDQRASMITDDLRPL